MNRRDFLRGTGAVAAGLTLAPLGRASELPRWGRNGQGTRYAEGVVFHDRNGNGRRDSGDPGVAGVCVSNGREVVQTDRDGRYRIPVSDDTVLFVIKPSGWMVPVNAEQLPQHSYVHKPQGSPEYRYSGLKPTGDLPVSVDFALRPQRESNKFRMVLFGDPQPRNQKEIDYIAHDVVEQVIRDVAAQDCKFGLSLGDEMFDNLSLYDSLNRTISGAKIPWYNTVGNHDMNYDSVDDAQSVETFKRIFGAPYYAFNYGKVHFIVLDDVIWHGSQTRGYHGELTRAQLDFVRNDLRFVPKDQLVVVAMHIPLVEVENREALYRLLEDRPFTLSLSAHTHVQRNYFLEQADGWRGKTPHHHLNHATVCGSWWEGAPDERGIPHATMSDGAPNGYSIVEFDGTRYKVTFRAASRPEWDQMRLWLPEEVKSGDLGKAEIIANVFAGSSRSVVEMRINDGKWVPMTNYEGKCPYFVSLKEAEAGPNPPAGLKLPNPSDTPHLWKGALPTDLPAGTHFIEVRTRDMYDQTYSSRRTVRITA